MHMENLFSISCRESDDVKRVEADYYHFWSLFLPSQLESQEKHPAVIKPTQEKQVLQNYV